MTTPRFMTRHGAGGCYISLDEADKGFRAVALCDQLHEGWDDPDGWDYGLSFDELGDCLRDGYKVQYFDFYTSKWIDPALTESDLRSRAVGFARYCRASKQPPSKTENVPLHKVIGRTLPGESSPIYSIKWWAIRKAWKWCDPHTLPWCPLPVNDDGTVTVLVDTPAATSDKGGRVMGPQRFRKKPVVVAAVRIDADDYDDMSEIVGWCGGTAVDHDGHVIAIDTLEGRMFADPGDWIIQGVKGEFYPCKPDIFEATYEAAS